MPFTIRYELSKRRGKIGISIFFFDFFTTFIQGLLLVSSYLDEILDHVQMAFLSCDEEGACAIVVGLLHVGSYLDEILDHAQVAVLSCDVKRSCAADIGLVFVGSLLDKILYCTQVAVLSCNEEGMMNDLVKEKLAVKGKVDN